MSAINKRRFISDDITLESMVSTIFNGNSKGAYALESEELSDGGELTTDEIEILENDDADPAFLGEESIRHLSDANSQALMISVAEKYLWKSYEEYDGEESIIVEKLTGVDLDDMTNVSEEQKKSMEADAAVKENIWSKFWEWIKDIFSKIRLGVINFFKKVQIWLAGDMKKFGDWYNSNQKFINDIKKSSITLKIRPLAVKFEDYQRNFDKVIKQAEGITNKISSQLKGNFWTNLTNGTHQVDIDSLKLDNDIIKKISPENFREELYGLNSIRVVTAEEFFKNFSIDNMKSAVSVKYNMQESQSTINSASVGIKTAIKASNITNESARRAARLYAVNLQHALSRISSGIIWNTSIHIQLLNISLRYCNKVMDNQINRSKTERVAGAVAKILTK